jgi:formylglycine-generating enzyme required for sulfatase activity
MTQQEFFNRYHFDVEEDYIGGGGFGNVYKASDEILDRTVAIKVSAVQKDKENISLSKEVELAQNLPIHRNIVHYQTCYRFKMHNGIFDYGVLQYYPLGNLSQLIRNSQLTYSQKEDIANGILQGLHHLHQNNIVHRDVKSSNVLISRSRSGQYIPKIADFGLSKEFNDSAKSYFSNSFAGGSLLYVAPEQLKGGEIRKNVDLWSTGVMLFELFTGQVPFYPTKDDGTETARKEIIQQIEGAKIPAAINTIPKPWQTLIRKCLVVNSEVRLKDAEEVFAIINGGKPIARREEPTIIEVVEPTVIVADIPTVIEHKKPTVTTEPREEARSIPWLPILVVAFLFGAGMLVYLTRGGNEGAEEESLVETEEIIEESIPMQEFTEDGFEMVQIPSGTFQMGSNENDDEKPIHSVTLSSFKMSKYEVTQKQWTDIMGTNPSSFKNCDNCPVENVSWNDVQGFIKKLNNKTGKRYRLPTEAEWEYAARGGQNYKYAGSNNIESVAWYGYEKSGKKTHPIGQKSPNGYGLYDMSGNVWEWCEDVWHDNYSGAPTNGRAWTSGGNSAYRVLRGGSWYSNSEDCRSANRNDYAPTFRLSNNGFRLVLP